ncbi:MAG TPA: FHA domain-containing protein, partial [Thermoanaerobaculia bacterium]|nr:FHA domain-containing protein [Thermoanaerobaculia bacterium]
MLQVLFEADGRPQVFNLTKAEASIGRSNENDIVLNDFSVSRRHAYLKKENGAWVLYDNQSTNGIRVNDRAVPRSPVVDGDQALVGTFLLRFREEAEAAVPLTGKRLMDSTSTCIRPISEFNLDFGLEKSAQMMPESTDTK